MNVIVAVVKPLLITIATHPAVKQLVVDLLTKYVRTTDNSIDDFVLTLVKEKLFSPQA